MGSTTGCDPQIDIQRLTEPAKQVERYIDQFVGQRALPADLAEAIRYAALGPGKRLRPILVVRSCQAVGGEEAAALPAAAAIELIHAFSLVHDDLPAMDDDDLRRGRPTLHRHTSQAMAILAGDGMMGLAFELIATRIKPADRALAIVRELAIGTNDMVAGQVYDTLANFDQALEPMQRLELIHRHKTGALIIAACRMGAICGGADKPTTDALGRYAEAIGLMFQVVDDLLDVTQTTEHLGKTAGKDVAQEKLTYPALLGMDGSRQTIQKLRQAAHDALKPLGNQANDLAELCDYMAQRTR
jgi:geranylgeranyl diphosphate synthase type II